MLEDEDDTLQDKVVTLGEWVGLAVTDCTCKLNISAWVDDMQCLLVSLSSVFSLSFTFPAGTHQG